MKRWIESRCDYSARQMRALTFEKPVEIPIEDEGEDKEKSRGF